MTECNDFKLSKTSNHCLIIQSFSVISSLVNHMQITEIMVAGLPFHPHVNKSKLLVSRYSLKQFCWLVLLAAPVVCRSHCYKPRVGIKLLSSAPETKSWMDMHMRLKQPTLKSSKNLRPKAHARVEKSTTPQSRCSLVDMKQKQHCSCVAGWSWLTILNKG